MDLQSLLSIVAMTVVSGGALSVALYVPLMSVAESVPPDRPAYRAIVWLVGLYAPVLGGIFVALLASHLAANTLASPHDEGLRTHICFMPLVSGPDGPFRGKVIAWAALGLLVAGLARFAAGAVSSVRLKRAAEGLPAVEDGGSGATIYHLSGGVARSYSVGLWQSVPVLSLPGGEAILADERRAVIAHELRHARRRDNLLELLNATATTILVFLPTPYLYRRYWRQEAEFDCDAAAAAATSPQTVRRALRLFGEAGEGELSSSVERRLARLSGEGDEVVRDTTLMLIFLAIGAMALGAAAIITRRQMADSLHCMATAFLSALRR